MKTRKVQIIWLVVVVSFLMVGCAGIQEKWNALSSDEKARIILNDLQSQLNTVFDVGKAFVASNPQYKDKWKTQIVPAFDVANNSLLSAMNLVKTGQLTPDQAYSQVQPVINSVINLLISIGAVKKTELLPDKLKYPIKPLEAAMDFGDDSCLNKRVDFSSHAALEFSQESIWH